MSMTLLRWSLALVLGSGAVALLMSLAHGGHPGLPLPVSLALGGSELVAAAALLVPGTRRAGGLCMIAVLAAAAGLHVATGQVPPISFVVYAAAIWAVIAEPAS